MAKKKHVRYEKVEEKKSAIYESRNFQVAIAVVAVVIVIGVIFGTGIVHFPGLGHGPTYVPPPNQVPYGQFVEITSTSYAPSNTYDIYFISWIGCPFGAGESWSLYGSFLSYYPQIVHHVRPNYSDPNEGSDANIPGLLFNDSFSFTAKGNTYNFNPLYVYNETLFGSWPGNNPISSSDLVSFGLNAVNNSGIPSVIASLETKYTTQVGTDQGKPSAFLGNPAHVNTVLFITGPQGTWMLNGPPFDPSNLRGYTTQYLQSNYGQIAELVSFESALNSKLGLS